MSIPISLTQLCNASAQSEQTSSIHSAPHLIVARLVLHGHLCSGFKIGIRQLPNVFDGRRQALCNAVDHCRECQLRLVLPNVIKFSL